MNIQNKFNLTLNKENLILENHQIWQFQLIISL